MAGLETSVANKQIQQKASLDTKLEELTPDINQDETKTVAPPIEPVFNSKHTGVKENARILSNIPSLMTRQQIFRSLATKYGNSYATKITTLMRRPTTPAVTADPPDELDTLIGLSTRTTTYNDEQLQQARQLAVAETNQAKRVRLFNLLQTKVTYYNQNKNESKAFNSRTHRAWSLGIGMCNVTSLAMTLEGVGITFSQAKSTYPNTFEDYKAAIMAEKELSLKDRQQWVSEVKEATRFPDFLEQLRLVNHFKWLTVPETWQKLANLFGASLTLLAGEGVRSKQWWLDNAQAAFDSGNSVLVGIQGHIIRLQGMNEDGLIFDDPNAHLDLSKGMVAHDGTRLDHTWNYSVTGNDSLVPWDVAERYDFQWVRQVSGVGGTVANASSAQSAQTAKTGSANPTHDGTSDKAAQTTTNQEILSVEEQQKALAAMNWALLVTTDKNKVVDCGYFAIRNKGKINPTDTKAVAEWKFIQDKLLPRAIG